MLLPNPRRRPPHLPHARGHAALATSPVVCDTRTQRRSGRLATWAQLRFFLSYQNVSESPARHWADSFAHRSASRAAFCVASFSLRALPGLLFRHRGAVASSSVGGSSPSQMKGRRPASDA